MAGLLDFHQETGSAQALAVLCRLADYLHGRIHRLIASKGVAWWQQCLETEYGGMNEVPFESHTHSSMAG